LEKLNSVSNILLAEAEQQLAIAICHSLGIGNAIKFEEGRCNYDALHDFWSLVFRFSTLWKTMVATQPQRPLTKSITAPEKLSKLKT
jgi:hypothetical protein